MRLLLAGLCLCIPAQAQEINQKYSHGSFQDQQFKEVPASEFNNSRIVNSNFYQLETPNSDIFPDDMTGVIFDRCNLDNVKIKGSNTVLPNCSNRKIQVQNDLEDWILDNNLDPVTCTNPFAPNQDPTKIPSQYILKSKINKLDWDQTYGQGIIPDDSQYKVIPTITKTKDKTMTIDVSLVKWQDMQQTQNYYPLCEAPSDVKIKTTHDNQQYAKLKGREITYEIEGEAYRRKDKKR